MRLDFIDPINGMPSGIHIRDKLILLTIIVDFGIPKIVQQLIRTKCA